MFDSKDIVTIGEGLIELSSNDSLFTSNHFDKFYGSDTLCACIAAKRMGANVGYITKLGNDHFGEYLLDAWQFEGLDTSQIKLCEGKNGIYFVGYDMGSKDLSYYRSKTAAQKLSVDDINFDYIKSTRAVYLTGNVQFLSLSCAEVVDKVMASARENGIITAYDVNYMSGTQNESEAREHFETIQNNTDIIFLDTKHDAQALFGLTSHDKIHKILSDTGIKTSVIKENGVGIHIYDNDSYFNIPFLDINVIDTTGAQSTFNGAFLSFILQGYDTVRAARYAYCAGALQTQGIGAVKSIPYLEAVQKFYKEKYE